MIHKELSPPSRRRTVWLFLPRVLHHAARPMPAVGPIKMPASTKLILRRVMCVVVVIPQTDLFLQFDCSPKPAGLFLWNWRQTNESQGKWRNLFVTSQTLIHAMRQNIPLSIPQSPVVFCGKIKTNGRRCLQSCHWLHASLRTNFQFWKQDGFFKLRVEYFTVRIYFQTYWLKDFLKSNIQILSDSSEARANGLWFVFRLKI